MKKVILISNSNWRNCRKLMTSNWQFCPQARAFSLISSTVSKTNVESYQGPPQANAEKWDLYVGLCIERKPIISKELTPLEKRYTAFLQAYEFESSKKSDHERRHEKDKKLLDQIKKGEIEQGTVDTAQDIEDKYTAEALKFVPMSRTTVADKENDTKSLNRSLSTHLLLLVQQEIGQNDYQWCCPQLKLSGNENLREVANNILANSFPDMKAQILGNAPWGFYQYRFSQKVKKSYTQANDSPIGAKVFFYKATYLSGCFKPASSDIDKQTQTKFKDFIWATRAELKQKLIPKYYNSLSQCLIDEN